MVNRLLRVCLLLCALCLMPSLAGASAPPDVPAMGAAAQDGGGTVWALPWNSYGNDSSHDGLIYRWQAGAGPLFGTWTAQAPSGAARFRPRALTHGDDGSVYVYWQKDAWQNGVQGTPQCLVTVHRGVGSRILARFSAAILANPMFPTVPIIYAGTGGDIWLIGDQPTLWHLTADGTAEAFPVRPDQCFGGQAAPPGFPTQPIRSLTDGLGRRWFWQNNGNNWGPGTLRGVFIWDGKTLGYHATLPGLPDRPLSALAALDPHHFWAAQPKDSYPWVPEPQGGLYQIDTQTLAAVPEAPPTKEAFQSVTRIFRISRDLCILEGASQYQAHPVLWHRHGTQWHREPQALADSQATYGYGDAPPQAVLETAQGTWLAVNRAGLSWLPHGGQPAVQVDWRRGLTIGRVSDLFRLPDGKIMAFSTFGYGCTVVSPRPHPLYPARPCVLVGTQAVPKVLPALIADPRRHLWGLEYFPNNQHALTEWDGSRWQRHRLPKDIPANCQCYGVDTLGRLWLTTSVWNPPSQPQPVEGRAVYDPVHDTWANYATVPEALQAVASVPGMAFLPHLNLSQLPVFSGDGRVAYLDNSAVFLYDGKTWQHWKAHDILPSNLYNNSPYSPRFNPKGHLAVDLDTQTWEWTPDGGWQLTGPVTPASAPPPLPPGGPKDFGGYPYPVPDNGGAQWIDWNGAIYLIRHGLWRRQPALSGPGSPFWDSRSLVDVLLDPDGHYFFQTNSSGSDEYVVWSPPNSLPPPPPRLQIAPLSADSVRLRLTAVSQGPHWFQWRLNGGAWSAPQTANTVLLQALSYGRYRVEAQAVDTLLQASPRPSAAVFVLQPASTAQIARWVRALLSGPDDAREAAVAGLVKQPADALPALTAARSGASESARWWLEAAIQQIMDKNAPSENAPPE